MTTRVALTGASGWLGSAIAAAMAERSDLSVTALVRAGTGHRVPGLQVREVDLTDQRSAEDALATIAPQHVLHAAGRVHGTPLELYRDNTVATVVLCEAMLRTTGTGAVLTMLGSAAEYGRPAAGETLREDTPCHPVGAYGHSKLAASAYLAACSGRGLRSNLLRVFNPVGRVNGLGQVIGAFIAKAAPLRDRPGPRVVQMGRLDAVRDFVVVDDLVHALLRLVEAGASGGTVVNACSGEGRPVRELIGSLIRHSGVRYDLVEAGEAPAAGRADIVVGDPTRFLDLLAPRSPASLEDTLAAAWDIAVAASRSDPGDNEAA